MRMRRIVLGAALVAWLGLAQSQVPPGRVKGDAWKHTAESAEAVMRNAWVAIPAAAGGGAPYYGRLADAPGVASATRVPVVVFLHGSSGINDAIKLWQKWLADDLGIASIAPDSMQLPDRITYSSPVAKDIYEKVHALRAQELALAVGGLSTLRWADPSRLVIAGTSEGAVSVARYRGADGAPAEIARIIFSWSCEANYHVAEPRNAIPATLPVLNVMSSTDVYFSPGNAWLGNPAAKGHCADALAEDKSAVIVLLPQAPHTLFNLPAARGVVKAFLQQVVR